MWSSGWKNGRSSRRFNALTGRRSATYCGRPRESRSPRPGSVEEELRARLLSTVARLGHGLIDIYLLTIARLGSLDLRTLESDAGGGQSRDERRITEYLATLEKQRTTPLSERAWGAFDELRELATNFDLILDVNAPEARDLAVS